MMKWFHDEQGVVGVFDATNSTVNRRNWILQLCKDNSIEPMFIESWCDDLNLIKQNMKDILESSPDYKDQDPDFSLKDLIKRISKYEEVYESVNDSNLTYVKIINVSSQVVINRITSYLESRIVYYLMNLHIKPRSIWLSRHGESMFNLTGQIGGDADLSKRGLQYSKVLPELVMRSVENDKELTVWTSTLKRTQQTARHLKYPQLQWKALDELDSGVCDAMTYAEVEEKFPDDFKARDDNKFEYRYRGGESYRDVVIRLEPIIMELERQENILIVTHQAVLRCIYAYFMNVPQDQSPWMDVPLHTLIRIEPRPYYTVVTKLKANIDAVSTYRSKGSSTLGTDEKYSISKGEKIRKLGEDEGGKTVVRVLDNGVIESTSIIPTN